MNIERGAAPHEERVPIELGEPFLLFPHTNLYENRDDVIYNAVFQLDDPAPVPFIAEAISGLVETEDRYINPFDQGDTEDSELKLLQVFFSNESELEANLYEYLVQETLFQVTAGGKTYEAKPDTTHTDPGYFSFSLFYPVEDAALSHDPEGGLNLVLPNEPSQIHSIQGRLVERSLRPGK